MVYLRGREGSDSWQNCKLFISNFISNHLGLRQGMEIERAHRSPSVTSDVLEYMKISELPGYLITIDIEKAFDSVDHTFLVAVSKKFGFGDDFIRWVRIILNRQESCIMNNGHSTAYFPLSSGTRQGDPISAYLFILVMEIFLYKSVLTQTLKVLHYLGMNSS